MRWAETQQSSTSTGTVPRYSTPTPLHVRAHCTKKADEVVPVRNVWLVHTIEVYDLIVIYLHTPHTIPNNKVAIKLALVAVCPLYTLYEYRYEYCYWDWVEK